MASFLGRKPEEIRGGPSAPRSVPDPRRQTPAPRPAPQLKDGPYNPQLLGMQYSPSDGAGKDYDSEARGPPLDNPDRHPLTSHVTQLPLLLY